MLTPDSAIRYAPKLTPNDRCLAVLARGEQKGLWRYHARHVHQGDTWYLVERDGEPIFLSPQDVERLLFDHFMQH